MKIYVRHWSLIDAIKVEYEDGVSSPWYGGSGGALETYTLPSGRLWTAVKIRFWDLVDGF